MRLKSLFEVLSYFTTVYTTTSRCSYIQVLSILMTLCSIVSILSHFEMSLSFQIVWTWFSMSKVRVGVLVVTKKLLPIDQTFLASRSRWLSALWGCLFYGQEFYRLVLLVFVNCLAILHAHFLQLYPARHVFKEADTFFINELFQVYLFSMPSMLMDNVS